MRYIFLPALLLFISGSALAVHVDPNAPDGVAARYFADGSNMYALCTNGYAYRIGSCDNCPWVPLYMGADLPIPIVEILDWAPDFFTTHSGDIWGYLGI